MINKQLKEYGRFGDTELAKTSSGENWHVNKLEKLIIERMGKEGEAYVDAGGSGTTNPDTGYKEQNPVALGMAAIGLGMKLYGMYQSGKAAQDVDSEGAISAAEDIQGVEQTSAWDEYKSERGRQLTSAVGKVTGAAKNAKGSLMDLFSQKETITGNTNLVKSGEAETAFDPAEKSIREDYSTSATTAQEEYDYSGRGINLAQQKQFAAIEERFQSRLSEIERVPDTFKEGFFGYSNYTAGA
tara:strand:- start:3713 stop:4438 length:726 start_codon:yes stop_codon:yes gene_type:complete